MKRFISVRHFISIYFLVLTLLFPLGCRITEYEIDIRYDFLIIGEIILITICFGIDIFKYKIDKIITLLEQQNQILLKNNVNESSLKFSTNTIKCISCGKEIEYDVAFCEYCGANQNNK